MSAESTKSSGSPESPRRLNLDQCIHCVHYEALGCAGSVRCCAHYDIFPTHDPACLEVCPDRVAIEGAN